LRKKVQGEKYGKKRLGKKSTRKEIEGKKYGKKN
jgi:hypothetical protein